ncbi:hypothetical protein [Roseovarius sp. SYSU LYC5161]
MTKGLEIGEALASNADVVFVVTALIAAATEAARNIAKKRGWTL